MEESWKETIYDPILFCFVSLFVFLVGFSVQAHKTRNRSNSLVVGLCLYDDIPAGVALLEESVYLLPNPTEQGEQGQYQIL